ncbi:hypothetical protein [Agrobacterium sp. NPDC090283]|uniref:hypothetical protein n=1 Tax=Agrobacterium sp. NPDC090283 TaxID=3363920 RepID=UPI00383B22AA
MSLIITRAKTSFRREARRRSTVCVGKKKVAFHDSLGEFLFDLLALVAIDGVPQLGALS